MTLLKRADTLRAAAIFHALSDELRLDVVNMLLDGERCVCELTDELDIAQSRLSWHLKTLKDAGIVNDRREGRWIYYSLNAEAIHEARSILDGLKVSVRSSAVEVKCC